MKFLIGLISFSVISLSGFHFFQQEIFSKTDIKITNTDTQFVCIPCGYECDKIIHTKSGICTSCNMKLVDRSTVKFNSIAPENVCSFIAGKEKNNVILLDVRTPDEFNGKAADKFGRLAGAINIPVQELEKRMEELKKYRNKEIIVYCSHSHRSPMASYMLMQNGFMRVTNMEFGMSEWNGKVKPGACNNKLYVKQ